MPNLVQEVNQRNKSLYSSERSPTAATRVGWAYVPSHTGASTIMSSLAAKAAPVIDRLSIELRPCNPDHIQAQASVRKELGTGCGDSGKQQDRAINRCCHCGSTSRRPKHGQVSHDVRPHHVGGHWTTLNLSQAAAQYG